MMRSDGINRSSSLLAVAEDDGHLDRPRARGRVPVPAPRHAAGRAARAGARRPGARRARLDVRAVHPGPARRGPRHVEQRRQQRVRGAGARVRWAARGPAAPAARRCHRRARQRLVRLQHGGPPFPPSTGSASRSSSGTASSPMTSAPSGRHLVQEVCPPRCQRPCRAQESMDQRALCARRDRDHLLGSDFEGNLRVVSVGSHNGATRCDINIAADERVQRADSRAGQYIDYC